MNRLNPLYIILLFITIVFLSFYSISNEKNAYSKKVEEARELEIKALEFKNLVNAWTSEKYINSTLDEISKSQIFVKETISRSSTKELIKIRIDSANLEVLDIFLNKVLNKQLIIKRMQLDKNSINLEIGIK
ncbi:MAG: hypothetical protein PHY66_11540 [Aliarcobacter sp.]|nr:hypothetical protein [Aliarcobacter sp.]